MTTIERLQRRNQLRNVIQETLHFIIQEIEAEIVAEASRLKRIRKRKWVANRDELDESNSFLKEITINDPSKHFSALRMTEGSFNWLLKKVEPFIQKSDTIMRMALPAALKLQIVLHLFAMGGSLRNLELLYGVSKTSISLMIVNVCDAIYKALKDYIQVPRTREEWIAAEAGFRKTWNFPGCCGAIDMKHIVMKTPCDAGSHYNKKQNGIVLLAVCNDDYCFKYIEILYKIISGSVFQDSNLNNALENNLLPSHHVIVGDAAFPLKTFLMIPYEGNHLTNKEKVFNCRLSRARLVAENAIGILLSRFRIFERAIPFTPDKIEKIVKACCALHNWLRMTKCPIHVATVDEEDTATGNIIPGSWRNLPTDGIGTLPPSLPNCPSQDACQIRDKYTNIFYGEEAINLQGQMKN